MTIDILIPTYNRKDYLKKAIDSILKQSYKNINIIISDNNSNDWTNELVNEYLSKYGNIFYYKQEKNIWPWNNYKKCLYEYAKSDYILFLSDDDELFDEKYIEKAIEVIKNNKDIVIVMSNTKLVYDDLNLEFVENKKIQNIIDWKNFFINYWIWDYSISWCNAIFNRKLAIENDCYNSEIFYADSDSFFRLMMFWKIAFIPVLWSIYRLHSKNSYKITNLETYIKNIDYIIRNYEFAKKYININELNNWTSRMCNWYWNTVYNNLILFSTKPISNILELNKYIKYNSIIVNKSIIDMVILFIARYLMKIKFIHKKMILLNNRK